MTERVLITGLGLHTPLGADAPTTWAHLENASLSASPGPLSGYARAEALGAQTAEEALRMAGLWDGQALTGINPERIGCTFSASKPLWRGDGLAPAAPDEINRSVRRRFGLLGESRNVIAACATGAYAIATAADWIEQGVCDAVVAGSVEPYPHALIQAGFHQMGVVSEEEVMRPFARNRSGFVFGEGAGVLVLESALHQTRRRREPLARLSGWGRGTDPHSAVAFNSNGAHIAGVIGRALGKAGVAPAAIAHANAHGTATRVNDWIETQALYNVFADHAPKLMISATKASTGHLLGAAGSVEAALTVLALRHQWVPPTRTLEEPDPSCALDYTPQVGHPAAIGHAVSLSFGFGGPIGVLVISAW